MKEYLVVDDYIFWGKKYKLYKVKNRLELYRNLIPIYGNWNDDDVYYVFRYVQTVLEEELDKMSNFESLNYVTQAPNDYSNQAVNEKLLAKRLKEYDNYEFGKMNLGSDTLFDVRDFDSILEYAKKKHNLTFDSIIRTMKKENKKESIKKKIESCYNTKFIDIYKNTIVLKKLAKIDEDYMIHNMNKKQLYNIITCAHKPGLYMQKDTAPKYWSSLMIFRFKPKFITFE